MLDLQHSLPDPAHLQSLGVMGWPTWGCEVSTFPWTYDAQETCLLLEGDVTVTPRRSSRPADQRLGVTGPVQRR